MVAAHQVVGCVCLSDGQEDGFIHPCATVNPFKKTDFGFQLEEPNMWTFLALSEHKTLPQRLLHLLNMSNF